MPATGSPGRDEATAGDGGVASSWSSSDPDVARRVAQASLLRRVADELATRPVDADEWAPVAAALTALLDPAGGPHLVVRGLLTSPEYASR